MVRQWAESGIRQVSLRRLAAELGVSATAIYYHIPDKDALIGSAAQVIMKDWARTRVGVAGPIGCGRYLSRRTGSCAVTPVWRAI